MMPIPSRTSCHATKRCDLEVSILTPQIEVSFYLVFFLMIWGLYSKLLALVSTDPWVSHARRLWQKEKKCMSFFEWFAKLIEEYGGGPRLDNFIQGVIALALALFLLWYMADNGTKPIPTLLGGCLLVYSLAEILVALVSKGKDSILIRLYKKFRL